MYNLIIAPRAQKRLKEIAKLHYKQAIKEALAEIEDDPFVGKPLSRELTGQFTYKLGVFRIIYTVNEKDKTINVITAGHRSTIYS